MQAHTFPSTEPLELIWFEKAIREWNHRRADGGTCVDRFLFLPEYERHWILARARELKSQQLVESRV